MLEMCYKYRYLIAELIVRDIKTKYRRSVLGLLWSFLNPLFMLAITAMVFSEIFRFNVENYVLYLICGQVMFAFYSEATSFAMGSILGNGSLIKKVYIPKYLFPVSRVLSSAVNLCFMLPALLVIMIATGAHFSFIQLTFVIPVILFLIFSMGVGLLLGSLVVLFRDLNYLYGIILHALSLATPIFYPESIIPQKFSFLLTLNPIYYYIKAFRSIIVNCQFPAWDIFLPCVLLAALAILIGGYAFNKTQNRFVLYI